MGKCQTHGYKPQTRAKRSALSQQVTINPWIWKQHIFEPASKILGTYRIVEQRRLRRVTQTCAFNKKRLFAHMQYIEDIYFFEVNTKYISSSGVKKISIFHECVARVKMLIFSPHEMKYIWYLPKKSKFSFYFIFNSSFYLVVSRSI